MFTPSFQLSFKTRRFLAGLLPLFVLMASVFASSEGWSADRSAQRAIREVMNECFDAEHLQRLVCSVHRIEELPEALRDSYDRNVLDTRVLDPLFGDRHGSREREPTHGILAQLEELNRRNQCHTLGSGARVCDIENTNAHEFDLFVRLFQDRVIRKEVTVPARIRPYFRAYAAKCAASVLLPYEERENQRLSDFVRYRFLSSIEDVWARGIGECQEIARLTTELGRSLEVPIRNVSTLYHEFNETEVNGQILYLDGTSAGCTFFRR